MFLSVEGRQLCRRVWRWWGCCTRWRSSALPSTPSGTAAGRGTAGPSWPTSGSTSLGCPATPRSPTIRSDTPDSSSNCKCSEFFLNSQEFHGIDYACWNILYLNSMPRLRVDQVVVQPLILRPLPIIAVPESSEKIKNELMCIM